MELISVFASQCILRNELIQAQSGYWENRQNLPLQVLHETPWCAWLKVGSDRCCLGSHEVLS